MLSTALDGSLRWCSSCCVRPSSSVSRRTKRSSMASKRPAISSGVVFVTLSPSLCVAISLAPGAEARPPGLTDVGEQFWRDHLLTVRARVSFHGLNHHTPRKGWNSCETLTRRLFPAQFLGNLKTERLRCRQVDDRATILARLVGAGGVLG